MSNINQIQERKNIILSGSFSTGKSTVFDHLSMSDDFEFYIFKKEPSRKRNIAIIENKKIKQERINTETYIDLSNSIMSNKKFVFDTSIFDTIPYSEKLNVNNDKIVDSLKFMLAYTHNLKNYNVFFFPTGIHEIVNDEYRHSCSKFQREVNDRILELYNRYNIKYTILNKDFNTNISIIKNKCFPNAKKPLRKRGSKKV